MLTIRLDSKVPIGDQIVSGLRRLIANAALLPGDSLPTVRQLAADLGINLNTVARAYRTLEEAGLVATVRGRGTVVTASADAVSGSAKVMRERIAAQLEEVMTNAKLAGLDRLQVEKLCAVALDKFWDPSI